MPKRAPRGSQGGSAKKKAAKPAADEPAEEEPPAAAAKGPKGAKGNKGKKSKRGGAFPTVEEIEGDPLTAMADKYWAPTLEKMPKYDAGLVEKVFKEEIEPASASRLVLLDFSCYLERYLWPNFDAEKSSDGHVLSIISMVNEKFRESLEAFTCFQDRADVFPAFFERVLQLRLSDAMTLKQRTVHTVF